jgi:E3 ubiquitin-protein ligase RNF38/44
VEIFECEISNVFATLAFNLSCSLGNTNMPNGNTQDYQAGHSSIHGPLPHFCQNPLHSMQAPQIQVPHQEFINNNVVHGLNPSAIGLPLHPRMLALPFNAEHTFGHPMHPTSSIVISSTE